MTDGRAGTSSTTGQSQSAISKIQHPVCQTACSVTQTHILRRLKSCGKYLITPASGMLIPPACGLPAPCPQLRQAPDLPVPASSSPGLHQLLGEAPHRPARTHRQQALRAPWGTRRRHPPPFTPAPQVHHSWRPSCVIDGATKFLLLKASGRSADPRSAALVRRSCWSLIFRDFPFFMYCHKISPPRGHG